MQAAEARLVALDYELCPHCEYEVKCDYLRCPSCMRKLKDRCHSCGKAVDPDVAAVPVLRGGDGRDAALAAGAPAPAQHDDPSEERPSTEAPPRGRSSADTDRRRPAWTGP